MGKEEGDDLGEDGKCKIERNTTKLRTYKIPFVWGEGELRILWA